MVEKWMQGNRTNWNTALRGKAKSVRMGMPAKLFKDSDRDGVPNVFDCKPRNRRRQDVISPMSGGNPLQDMWGRQEQARQARDYQRKLAELQRLEEEKLKEMQRLSNVTVLDRTVNRTSYAAVNSRGEVNFFSSEKQAKDFVATPTTKNTSSANVSNDVIKPVVIQPKTETIKVSTPKPTLKSVITTIIKKTPTLFVRVPRK